MDFSFETQNENVAKKLKKFLKVNNIYFETSAAYNNTHFSITCDEDIAKVIDDELDRIYSADNKLTESKAELAAVQNNETYKKAKAIAEKYGYKLDGACYVREYSDTKSSIYF